MKVGSISSKEFFNLKWWKLTVNKLYKSSVNMKCDKSQEIMAKTNVVGVWGRAANPKISRWIDKGRAISHSFHRSFASLSCLNHEIVSPLQHPQHRLQVHNCLMQVENSPFVERLLKKGYEVIFMVEAVDEYAINSLPEFEGKKFQNVAKEGLSIDEGENAKERMEELKKAYEPLTKWLSEEALKDEVCTGLHCFTRTILTFLV